MSRADVETIMDILNLHSGTRKRNTVSMYQRYLEVKRNYGDEYDTVVSPYRDLIRQELKDGQSNPLSIAANKIELLALDTDYDRIMTDLVVCAAIDLCLDISLNEIAGKIYERGNTIH